jgi:hypothetical protein
VLESDEFPEGPSANTELDEEERLEQEEADLMDAADGL